MPRFAPLITLLGFAALGALEAWRGEPLAGLHAVPNTFDPLVLRGAGALLVVLALAALVPEARRTAGLLLAFYWAIFAALALLVASSAPTHAPGWVNASETFAFACAAFALRDTVHAHTTLRIVFALMLILFGAIHLVYRADIASLIPDWTPLNAYWPWLTGAALMIAGLACIANDKTTPAAVAVAVMFASWIPLVHIPRILAAPASMFEWTFAFTAVALAGIALQVAGRRAA